MRLRLLRLRPPLLAVVLVLNPCWGSSTSSSAPSAPTAGPPPATAPTPGPAAQPALVAGSGGSAQEWCDAVFRTNRRFGTMIGNQYSRSAMTNPQLAAAVARSAIENKARYIAIAPPEIRADVAEQVALYEGIIAWHEAKTRDPSAPPPPILRRAAASASQKRLWDFQVQHCGLNPQIGP